MTDQSQDRPCIFLIEEDDDTRPVLKQNLQRHGYRVLVALDEEDALERAGGAVARADMVLVNLVGKSAEVCLAVGRHVRERAKYDGHTPLVVMPEKYSKSVEGTDVNVENNDWILYLGEEPDQLKNLLHRLLPTEPVPG
jgi:DNA-binding response OmpR family regulator